MKRIENLNMRRVCTQGIVRDDGPIHIYIAWFPPAASLWIRHAGFTAANDSSFPVRYSDECFAASFWRCSPLPIGANNYDSSEIYNHSSDREPLIAS
jgi:hypothetical protein